MQSRVIQAVNELVSKSSKKITRTPELNPDRVHFWDEVLDTLYSVAKASDDNIQITIVSPRHAGLGDVIFGARLAELLQRYYSKLNIIVITNDQATLELIKKLKIDDEFNINIMAADDYQKLLNDKTISQPDLIIEAPVFSILEKYLYQSFSPDTPVLLISEYSVDSNLTRGSPSADQLLRSGILQNIFHNISTMNTGLDAITESGILIEDRLTQRIISEQEEWKKINPNLKQTILQAHHSLKEYKDLTNLAIGYAHNNYYRLLGGFIEFEKYTNKNADIILISDDIEQCKIAIDQLKNVFQRNGFDKIILYNVNKNDNFAINITDLAEKPREFRIIFTKELTHEEIISLHRISGPYKGATGDQSFTEAISCSLGAIINYEVMYHKIDLVKKLRLLAEKFASEKNIPIFTTVIRLLTWGPDDDAVRGTFNETNLIELGNLIRDPEIQNNICEFNSIIRKTYDLEYMIILRVNRILLDIHYLFLAEKSREILQNINNEDLSFELSILSNMINYRDEFLIEYFQSNENTHSNKKFLDATQQQNQEQMLNALKKGANVNAKNSDGNGALDIAISCKNINLINLLCSVPDIDLNILNEKNQTPLYTSLLSGKFKIATLLLAKGANPNIDYVNGNLTGNALNYLIASIQNLENDICDLKIKNQYLKMMKKLLTNGLKINTNNINFLRNTLQNEVCQFKKDLLNEILKRLTHKFLFENKHSKSVTIATTDFNYLKEQRHDPKFYKKDNDRLRHRFFYKVFGKELLQQPGSQNMVARRKKLG